jgi:hypothetical protein
VAVGPSPPINPRARATPAVAADAADAALAAGAPRGGRQGAPGGMVLEGAVQQLEAGAAGGEDLADGLHHLVGRLDHAGTLGARQVREGAAALAGVPGRAHVR